jgi:RsiW-degrading membrane proteinase PrsW (M82 family)
MTLMSGPEAVTHDRRTTALAAGSVAISVAALIAGQAHLLPSGVAALVVLVAVTVGLRVALTYAARSASSAHRTRVMSVVSTAGLAISAVTVLIALPHLTKAGGASKLVTDVLAHGWTLLLLAAAAGPVRTLGWRAFAGAGFTGFLAVSGLSRLVGTPVVHKLGAQSLVATALWAPFTEEVLKALLVVAIAVLAVRRSQVRPSALDLVLLGSWTGTGFALFEDALYGRGPGGLSAAPPFSLLAPSELDEHVGGAAMVAGGHLVYTALIALGLAVTLLYRHTLRYSWLAAPVAFAVAFGEHVAVNSLPLLTNSGSEPMVERILAPLTLGGRLSSLLLIAGVIAVGVIEWRAVRPTAPLATWARLVPAEAARRMQALAARQTRPRGSVSPAVPARSPGGQR